MQIANAHLHLCQRGPKSNMPASRFACHPSSLPASTRPKTQCWPLDSREQHPNPNAHLSIRVNNAQRHPVPPLAQTRPTQHLNLCKQHSKPNPCLSIRVDDTQTPTPASQFVSTTPNTTLFLRSGKQGPSSFSTHVNGTQNPTPSS